MRTARLELGSRVTVLCVDTDATEDGTELATQLLHELRQGEEKEICYRRGIRHVRKLQRSAHHVVGSVQLQMEKRGKLQYLCVGAQPPARPVLEADQVLIRVCAVGLNFKDVLNVLMPDEAAYTGEVPLPGADFAGIIAALPDNKLQGIDSRSDDDGLAVGDRVFGLCFETSGMLRSEVVVRRGCLARMPRAVTFEQAGHMAMVFLTVEFALGEQAQLQAGERVLIHSAAGGVGLAAIQYAQRVGAEVFATASAPKHEYLRSLGVKHISTTRDEDAFAEDMGVMVGNRGVDVVLNSLTSGDYIAKTVALLAQGGRFIEIGKRNIWSHERMQRERPDVQYETHSLNELLPSEPNRLAPMLRSLSALVDAGKARPLPAKVFEVRGQLVDAFRWLQSGKCIGKVVVRVEPAPDSSAVGDGQGVVLVTGGLGGLGIVTAEALAEAGARCVVLASRSGRVKHADQGLEERLEAMRRSGVRVVLERCDTSDEAQVVALLKRVRKGYGALRVVVHSAGVLSDALLPKQDAESMQRVWGVKAAGAWFLHKHTAGKDKELKAFVLYSSVAALFGSAGQANYSAANAYLDGLAQCRVSQGLPAVSVQWPAVTGVGMAAAMDQRVRIDGKLSVGVKTVQQVIKQLVSGLATKDPVQAVLPRGMLEVGILPPASASLVEAVQIKAAGRQRQTQTNRRKETVVASRWQGLSSEDTRRQVLDTITSLVRELLGEEGQQGGLDPSTSLMDAGLDSLASTQLVRGLSESFGVKLSPTLMFDYPTINALTDHISSLVFVGEMVPQQVAESRGGHSVGAQQEGIAITGMGCRFPGGIEGPAMFWDAI
jgi:myxalamid-type polyketide synthase MxaB